ncbi:invasion associated locus B family protein [Modicisalibacter sp. 'Wilcox']|uniref:invasion associated locus B family protein n=1 Tax=Modicisalibacter sp. 'Wilcox' TaxID=2679914 RepID=UPI0013D73DBD|nr:invasion associated locus B family protein [Modicisalibacter sp. 'Wilcox']
MQDCAKRLIATGMLLMAMTATALAQQPTNGNADNIQTRTVQDWQVRCPTDAGQGRCSMTQLINNPDGNQPVLRVVVAYPPQADGPAMVFLLPLGVRLAPGLQLTVDGGKPIKFPYQVCVPDGCRADIPLKPALMQQLRQGSQATLSLIDPRGQRLDLAISLMGFSDASSQIAP